MKHTTSIPGILSKHLMISDTCREAHGDEGAIDEALAKLRADYLGLLKAWPRGKGARFNIALAVDYNRKK